MTAIEFERLLGRPLKPKWTMVLAPDGLVYARESDGTWYALNSEPDRPPVRPQRERQ